MHRVRSGQNACAAPTRPGDHFRHVRFWSKADCESSAAARPRLNTYRAMRSPHGAFAAESEPLAPDAQRFVAWLLDRGGVDPACYRAAPLARRLGACLRFLRAPSIADARERLEREPERLSGAISALLVGVTEFFRDPSVFSYLENVGLFKLSAAGAGLRVWSAGCADGAELYSVAILLAERRLLEGSTLLGTDCRADAIRQAERGLFEPARLESLDQRLRHTYFMPHRLGWQVGHRLRGATLWQQRDALTGPPDEERQHWDLILCRNVAIYLKSAATARLWTTLIRSLRIGGILVVGKAERPEQPLSLVRLAPCIFSRQR
ncbi:MAG: CheR family methyltransferase [Pirellulaceae bacterium]